MLAQFSPRMPDFANALGTFAVNRMWCILVSTLVSTAVAGLLYRGSDHAERGARAGPCMCGVGKGEGGQGCAYPLRQ